MIVDASVLLPYLVDDGSTGELVRSVIEVRRISAPALVDLEVVSAIRRQTRTGMLTDSRAAEAIADLSVLDLERLPHEPLLSRIWQLRDNLTPYDASYVALAERLDERLLTCDARLTNAVGPRCDFELLRL